MAYDMKSGQRDFAMPPQNSMGSQAPASGAGHQGSMPPVLGPNSTGLPPGSGLVIPPKEFKHCPSCGKVLAPSAPDVCANCERTKTYFGSYPKEMAHDSTPPPGPGVIKY
jgi:hypothetical protein